MAGGKIGVIETERLVGERIGEQHLDLLVRLHQDQQVIVTLGGHRTRPEVEAMLDRFDSHWRKYGFGLWMFTDRITGEPIGRGGLMKTDTGGPGGVEIGYAIYPEHWGQGYATEIARNAAGVAFDRLQFEALVCYTMVENAASKAVMEHVGFVYDQPVTHADLAHSLYRLDRTTWAAGRPAGLEAASEAG